MAPKRKPAAAQPKLTEQQKLDAAYKAVSWVSRGDSELWELDVQIKSTVMMQCRSFREGRAAIGYMRFTAGGDPVRCTLVLTNIVRAQAMRGNAVVTGEFMVSGLMYTMEPPAGDDDNGPETCTLITHVRGHEMGYEADKARDRSSDGDNQKVILRPQEDEIEIANITAIRIAYSEEKQCFDELYKNSMLKPADHKSLKGYLLENGGMPLDRRAELLAARWKEWAFANIKVSRRQEQALRDDIENGALYFARVTLGLEVSDLVEPSTALNIDLPINILMKLGRSMPIQFEKPKPAAKPVKSASKTKTPSRKRAAAGNGGGGSGGGGSGEHGGGGSGQNVVGSSSANAKVAMKKLEDESEERRKNAEYFERCLRDEEKDKLKLFKDAQVIVWCMQLTRQER